MKLNNNQIKRYSRQIVLKNVGPSGQKKLLKSSVLVVGAGGLGSPILLYLAGTGIGKISLYKKQKIISRDVPMEKADQALINLIKENGDWIDPI